MADVLREVVSSPWFEWRNGMRRVDDLGLIATIRRPRPGGYWSELADHPANVGPLLEMLRNALPADARVCADFISPCWMVTGHDRLGTLMTESADESLVVALARALLALPGKP